MLLTITKYEQDKIIQALQVLADEYGKCADHCVTRLSDGFRDDERAIRNLEFRIANLTERVDDQEMNLEIGKFLAKGQKINAIKYVRQQRGWGLKGAKDYVDKQPGYEPPPSLASTSGDRFFEDLD